MSKFRAKLDGYSLWVWKSCNAHKCHCPSVVSTSNWLSSCIKCCTTSFCNIQNGGILSWQTTYVNHFSSIFCYFFGKQGTISVLLNLLLKYKIRKAIFVLSSILFFSFLPPFSSLSFPFFVFPYFSLKFESQYL